MSGQARVTLLLELRNRLRSGMSRARQTVARNVNAMKLKLAELRQTHAKVIDAMSERIPELGNAIGLLANPYVLVTAAVVALGSAYLKAMAVAGQWQTSLAKANVTAQLTRKELHLLSGQLLIIGRRNVVDLMEVPEAFNTIISAGLDTNTALRTLEPTLKAAKAGFTDIKTVADAAVSTMNSSGVMDANKVYDILFATLNKGKAEFADVANYLPKIIPGARQAGFQLAETAGAFAFLTANGLRAEAASTALANAFKALSTPDIIYGSKTKGGFKSLGIEIFDAAGKMRKMVDIAGDLNKSMAGLTDEQRVKKFASIGLDMEAATGFSIMSQNVDALKDSIEFTTNSTGQLEEAVKNSAQPMDSWKVVGNELKAAMIQLGEVGVNWFGWIGEQVLGVINWFRELYYESTMVRDIIGIIGSVFEFAWEIAVNAVTRVYKIIGFVLSALNAVKVAVFGAGDGFEKMYLRVKPYIMWMYQYISAVASLLRNIAMMNLDGIKDSIDRITDAKSLGELKSQVSQEAAEAARKRAELDAAPPDIAAPGGITAPSTNTSTNTNTNTNGSTGTGNNSASKVTGLQGQPRNITINMDSMFKMGNLVSNNKEVSNMSKRELEAWFEELTKRFIRNLETSYS